MNGTLDHSWALGLDRKAVAMGTDKGSCVVAVPMAGCVLSGDIKVGN